MALVKWKFLRSFYFVNICAELPLVLEMCEYACFVSIGLWREKSTFEQNENKGILFKPKLKQYTDEKYTFTTSHSDSLNNMILGFISSSQTMFY